MLNTILTPEEASSIPSNVRSKIELAFSENLDQYLTLKALNENIRRDHEESIKNLSDQISEAEERNKTSIVQLEIGNNRINQLEEKIKHYETKCAELNETIERFESDIRLLRAERNEAVDAKISIQASLTRRISEYENLQKDYEVINQKYKDLITTKFEAISSSDGVQLMKATLEEELKRCQQAKENYNRLISNLEQNIVKHDETISRIRNDHLNSVSVLHAQLSQKTNEINALLKNEDNLKKTIENLRKRIDEMNNRLSGLGEEEQNVRKSYQKEIDCKTQLAELYKEVSDDYSVKFMDLTFNTSELKKCLSEATEKYESLKDDYEQKQKEYVETLIEKDEIIKNMFKELQDANDLINTLKTENMTTSLDTLSPHASAAYNMIKKGLSLTQIYTEYANVSKELLIRNKENEQLKEELESILHQMEEKIPILKKKDSDYQDLMANFEKMTRSFDDLEVEYAALKVKCSDNEKNSSFLNRENQRLKKSVTDLSRQVCLLLKELEESRGMEVSTTTSPQHRSSNLLTSEDVISQKLVTFHDIQELQANNQKLLAVVHELSIAYEESEKQLKLCNKEDLDNKIQGLEAMVQEWKEAAERHGKVTRMLKSQLKMYRMMCSQQMVTGTSIQKWSIRRSLQNIHQLVESGDLDMDWETEMHDSFEIVNSATQTDDVTEIDIGESVTAELEVRKNLDELKDEYEMYKKETSTNEKMLLESLERAEQNLSKAVNDATELLSKVELYEDKLKSMQANSEAFKSQITALETKCNSYQLTISNHEQTISSLRNEALHLNETVSKLEVELSNTKRDCLFLREKEMSLELERNMLLRDRQSQEALSLNIESIKTSIERSESDWKRRMEDKLDLSMKECSALRRRLQEEQDRYREKSEFLKNTTMAATSRLEDEKKENEKLMERIRLMKNELQEKVQEIEKLNEKLKESSSKSIYDLEMKIVYLQKELKSKTDELENNKEMLKMTKADAKEAADLSEKFEIQLVTETENFNKYKSTVETKISELAGEAAGLRQQNKKLTDRLNDMDGLKQTSMMSLNDELRDVKKKLTSANEELATLKEELRISQAELKEAVDAKLTAEKRYSDEMLLHTNDVKELGNQMQRIVDMENKIATLTSERNAAVQKASLSTKMWEEHESKLKIRIEEQNKRLKDLSTQNDLLYKQMQEIGMKISVSQGSEDESALLASEQNTANAQENYVRLISHLRREKNLLASEKDSLNAENARLQSEISLIKMQLEETREILDAERNKSQIMTITTEKHEELMQKVETLNAMTDSNRMLREDRDKLQSELAARKERLDKMEIEVITPLKMENKSLKVRLDATKTENINLQNECIRWRTRITELTEKINKNNMEEVMKSLNLERENHNKTLDDLRSVKQDKSRLEEQVRKLQSTTAERMTVLEKERAELYKELENAKINNDKLNLEFIELRKTCTAQETVTNEMKTSNAQLRLIAKKYKNQYTDLLRLNEEERKKHSELLADNGANNNAAEIGTLQQTEITDEEKESLREEGRQQKQYELEERLKELGDQAEERQRSLVSMTEEFNKLKAVVTAKEARFKDMIKQARYRIMTLTAGNTKYQKEAEQYKEKVQNAETLLRDENTARENVLRSSYENRISKLEKEKTDLQNEKDKLSKEAESMSQRIAALQRTQQGSKSVANTGPDKTICEPPTANIKPMAGPSSSSTKSQPSQQSVTVTPWRSISSVNETPLASIRPMSMQARTVAVLPTSQTTCNVSQSTVVVPPQQQLVDTSSSTSNIVEAFSSSPSSSSHTDYSMPSTSTSAVSQTSIRHMVVTPTQQPSHSAESTQQDMDTECIAHDLQTQSSSALVPAVSLSSNVALPVPPQMTTATVSQSQAPTVALVLPRIEAVVNVPVQSQSHGSTISNVDQSVIVASSQQTAISIVSASNQSDQSSSSSAVQLKLPGRPDTRFQEENDDSNPGLVSASNQSSNNQQHVASSIENIPDIVASSHQSGTSGSSIGAVEPSVSVIIANNANSSNTVTTTQAGLKRQREPEGESSKSSPYSGEGTSSKPPAKRGRMVITIDDMDDNSNSNSDISLRCSGLDVEYQVPTSSQRDQEFDPSLIIDSDGEVEDELEDEQTMPDDGIIDDVDENPDFDIDNDEGGYELEGYERDDQDAIEGHDLDEDINQDQDNEAEIMDEESNEVPNQSLGNNENSMTVRSSSDQQSSEATSSGNNNRGESSNVSGNLLNPFGRRPSAISPLSRQQTQTLVLSQGFEDNTGDDGIVPSTPTLFVPRRSDGFSEAVSSPHVPSGGRFIFSDSIPPNTRSGLSQVVSEGMVDDTRMDLSQLDDISRTTGRSVPTTPLQTSPRGAEIGQSESNDQMITEQEQQEESLGLVIAQVDPTQHSDAVELHELERNDLDIIVEDRSEVPVKNDVLDEGNDDVTSEGSQQTTTTSKTEDEGREAEAVIENTELILQPRHVTAGTARRSTKLAGRSRGNTITSHNWDGAPSNATRSSGTSRGRGTETQRGSYRNTRGRRPRSWNYSRY